ncbi:MBL fold metallo-hydrolase [Sneathiella limimaris]|uniref:MBL fold metallo-hydrolase n=1 Tax=Sneathiella limimaris TaxID=1964213 RepID=UPI00146C686D|nr:MBL fold metallo-hydrolase [Sneathiella limimaris]
MKILKSLVIGLALILSACSGMKETAEFDPTAPNAHHTPTGFRNLYVDDSQKSGFFDFLFKVRFAEDWPDEDLLKENPPIARTEVDLSKLKDPPADLLQVTWIGHSTLLIQYDGLNVLTDPMFSDRASPVSFAGPLRYTDPAISIEDLPPIDAIVISHNHYDHMDEDTIAAIGNSAHWLVPLGNKALLETNGVTNVTELDWWQKATLRDVTLTLTPTQHWSGRGLFDRFETLWGSWAIQFPKADVNLWFGGDTGYNDVQFKQIGNRLGPFNLSFIPVGAYEPRWFMKKSHVNPAEAVQIHQDIRSQSSIGIHWGTFVLTTEKVTEPPVALKQAVKEAGLPEDAFITLPIGGMKQLDPIENPRNPLTTANK